MIHFVCLDFLFLCDYDVCNERVVLYNNVSVHCKTNQHFPSSARVIEIFSSCSPFLKMEIQFNAVLVLVSSSNL